MKYVDPKGQEADQPEIFADDYKRKLRSQNAVKPSREEIIKVYEQKAKEMAQEAGQQIVAGGKAVAEASLNATENVCDKISTPLFITGIATGDPALSGAAAIVGTVGFGATLGKVAINPSAENVSSLVAKGAVYMSSRVGGYGLKSLLKNQLLSGAETRALAIGATTLEKVSTAGISLKIQEYWYGVTPEPQQ
jgi:hypothetical protein